MSYWFSTDSRATGNMSDPSFDSVKSVGKTHKAAVSQHVVSRFDGCHERDPFGYS